MINLRITGLYNRGQQDEYVELEAAARCDLEGLSKHPTPILAVWTISATFAPC